MKYKANVRVAGSLVRTLAFLSALCNYPQRRRLSVSGLYELVIPLMETFASDVTVAWRCADVIGNLTISARESAEDVIFSFNTVGTVCKAMSIHKGEEKVAQAGVYLLKSVAKLRGERIREQLMKHGDQVFATNFAHRIATISSNNNVNTLVIIIYHSLYTTSTLQHALNSDKHILVNSDISLLVERCRTDFPENRKIATNAQLVVCCFLRHYHSCAHLETSCFSGGEIFLFFAPHLPLPAQPAGFAVARLRTYEQNSQ